MRALLAPHMTLPGGFGASEDDAHRRAADLAEELVPLEAGFSTLECEEPLNRSLFLGAASNAGLDAAFRSATRICAAS